MSRMFVSLAVAVMMLGVSSSVVKADEGKEQTKVGTVKKVDVDAKQVVVMVARELTFTITDKTKISQHDQPAKLTDIKVDDKVSVTYVKNGDTRTASTIAIVKEK